MRARLVAFWECTRSGVADGFAHDQHARLYTNGQFGILYRLPPKVAKVFKQEDSFYMLERISFPSVQGYRAAKVTLQFDCSVVDGLDWLSYTWDTEEVHLIDAHE